MNTIPLCIYVHNWLRILSHCVTRDSYKLREKEEERRERNNFCVAFFRLLIYSVLLLCE